MFKTNIVECAGHADPLIRKAGVKVMGHICESDALLDFVKEDIEELTNLLIKSLTDKEMIVREAGMLVVGEFSEYVVPDFLEMHE